LRGGTASRYRLFDKGRERHGHDFGKPVFRGTQGVYRHRSEATDTDMTFGLFLPEEAKEGPVPVLWYLSGLTCTHENAMGKAGAQAWAAEQGIALVFPDTSPRGEGVADHDGLRPRAGGGLLCQRHAGPWASISGCGTT
jgi:S-formylglutathione hydrolase